ncbi:MAG: triose-phosphate isomerase, partial [Acidobacteria bacterium]
MRRPIIAGNWKMFKTRPETSAFFDALIPEIQNVEHCDIVVAPPFTALPTAVEEADGTRVAISAQDVHWEEQGAFTGEVSVRMLLDAGCAYTIVGHSERRQYFGETDEWVEKKARAAVNGGLDAIVCVGETLSERDAGQALEVMRRQV